MEKGKEKILYCASIALFVCFGIFTLLVKTVDVAAVGPMNTSVGFSHVNVAVLNFFGDNRIWYTITDWLGVIAIAVAFAFAVTGAVQLIIRKSLLKVDGEIIALGAIYILTIAFYVIFEMAIVNYRPVIMYKSPEASYPSSHAMIVTVIMITALVPIKKYVKNVAIKRILIAFCIALTAVTVIGRMISGVHWITDIIGGLLLSSSLIMLYYASVGTVERKANKKAA